MVVLIVSRLDRQFMHYVIVFHSGLFYVSNVHGFLKVEQTSMFKIVPIYRVHYISGTSLSLLDFLQTSLLVHLHSVLSITVVVMFLIIGSISCLFKSYIDHPVYVTMYGGSLYIRYRC